MKLLRGLKSRRRLTVAVGSLILLAFIAVNAIAFMQARAMTHFVASTSRTAPPERLSLVGKLKTILTGVRIPRPVNQSNPADVGLRYQTVRFGCPHNDDLEGWFIPADSSRGFFIEFHAYSSSKSSLLLSARALHDMGNNMGYDLLLVDFRGSGGSRGDQTTIGYDEANDVAGEVDYARKTWSPSELVLYGQSMGGAAILRAVAELNVRPSAIIIESTFDRLQSTVDNRFHAMGLPAFPFTSLLVFWGGWEQGYNGFAHNPADYAAKVHCPALVFQGGLDARVTTPEARNLFNNLAGPKEFELFENSKHCAFLGDDPKRWKDAIDSFLVRYQ